MGTVAMALLRETWRLTRARALFILTVAIVGGWVMLEVMDRSAGGGDAGALAAIAILAILAILPVTSVLRKGFPFQWDFTLPVPTWLLVAVPMVCLGLLTAAAYLVPTLLLGTRFDIALPLAPVAAWLAAIGLAIVACSWWTRYGAVRSAGWVTAYLAFSLGMPARNLAPEHWSELFAFGAAQYLPPVFIVSLAFAVTVLGVERQRRGDDWREVFPGRRGAPGAIGSAVGALLVVRRDGWGALFRAPCPSSSATRAELWLEMKYRGAPVLAIGAAIAVMIPVMFRIGSALGPWLPILTALGTLLVPVLVGSNASVWPRSRGWSTSMSAFEATRVLGTAQLVGLQVLVTVACTLGAWTLIGTSIWLSLPLFGDAHDIGAFKREAVAALGALPGHRLASFATVFVVQLSTVVALLLAFRALSTAYGKRLFLGCLILASYLILLAFAAARGWAGPAVAEAHFWTAAALAPLATVYFFRRVLLDRMLAVRHAGAVVVIWAAFAAAYLAFLRESGILLPETPTPLAALLLSSSLLPLAAVALAPWSFGLIRHA